VDFQASTRERCARAYHPIQIIILPQRALRVRRMSPPWQGRNL